MANFFYRVLESLLSIAKVFFQSGFFSYPNESDKCTCYILGNGPSLMDDIEVLKERDKTVIISVNHFPSTDLFTQIKPEYHVVLAPELFDPNVDEKYLVQSKTLFSAIDEKTNWRLTLFVPLLAKKYPFWRQHINNENVNVYYFNTTPIEGMSWVSKIIFNLKLGLPRPHNVLIPSIMLAIWMKIKNIVLLGTDHSWLKDIIVTADNQVLVGQRHFYNTNPDPSTMKNRGRGSRRLHEVLQKLVFTFKAYYEVQSYATFKKCSILNLTVDSFIDVFPKMSRFDYILTKRGKTS